MKKMNDKDLERFKRHVGGTKRYILTSKLGEQDEFEFKPLGAKHLPDFVKIYNLTRPDGETKYKLNQLLSEVKEGKLSESEYEKQKEELELLSVMKGMGGEAGGLILDLIYAMVKKSYPDVTDEMAWEFIDNNFHKLQEILMETNESVFSQDKEKLDKVQQLKDRLKNVNK